MKNPLHPVGDWQAMESVAAAKEIQKNKLVSGRNPTPAFPLEINWWTHPAYAGVSHWEVQP